MKVQVCVWASVLLCDGSALGSFHCVAVLWVHFISTFTMWVRLGCLTFCHHIPFPTSRKEKGPNSCPCSFHLLWLLTGQFSMLNQPNFRFSVPLVAKLSSSANWLGELLFFFFLAPAAVEPSASLFLHSYSSCIHYRAVPNSAQSHHTSPDQTFILGRQPSLLLQRT